MESGSEIFYHQRKPQKVQRAHRKPYGGERFFHRHPTAKRLLRRAYYSANKAPPHPTMSRRERDRLTAFYRPHTARLSEQLNGLGLALPPAWTQATTPHSSREGDHRT